MKVIGIIPAYNEGEKALATAKACLEYVDYIILVDDGSNKDIAQEESQNITYLRHSINRGQGAALRTGTTAALNMGADIIVHLDADGQHDPAQIPELLKPLVDNEIDVVFGSRFMGIEPQGMPKSRRILLWCGRWFNTFAQGIPRTVTDPQSGFRAIRATIADQINFKQDRMAHASEILRLVTRSNLKWQEVPVRVFYTEESLKKGQKNLDALKIAWQLFIGAFTR
ncbi:glycosyltransferase family 2 protein [Patescibacteria group bacterium]|nr:glycosyltransferase family 2 protein [Patescibacteria group bacterium]